ncbi:MAG: hypothetical protein IJM97_04615 [Clostridia bacterium]|nr:hypothetical protein [Clostridia bacterium]
MGKNNLTDAAIIDITENKEVYVSSEAKEASSATPETNGTPIVDIYKKVKVNIAKTRTEKDDVFVGVAGENFLIQRGMDVEVPYYVAEVLQRSERLLSEAMDYEDNASEKTM